MKSEEYREALDASSEECRVKREEYLADDIQSNGNLNWLSLSGRRAKPSSLSTLNSSLKGGRRVK